MKQVVCINPRRYNLTQGREYEVANNPTRGMYSVTNDTGKTLRYSADLFRDVLQEDNVDQIISTIVFSIQNIHRITITLTIDGETVSYTFTERLLRIGCSCGIHSITDITHMISFVNELEDRENLRVRVLAEIILYCTRVRDIGMMLISTNTNCANYEYLVGAVAYLRTNNHRIIETTSHNPNSGNNIVLYTFIVRDIVDDLDELEEEDDVEDIVDVAQLEE